MARNIVLALGGEPSSFALSRLDREKLYGKKQRVVVDEAGRPCEPAWLTLDGSALVPSGGTAHVWVDERWSSAPQESRVAVDPAGQPLSARPSTLGAAQTAREVGPQRILDCAVSAVYELAAESLAPDVEAALARGAILELPFRFRDGYEDDLLFVLRNEEGHFGLVARETGFPLLERAAPPPEAEPAQSELEADLDFSML